MKKTQNQLTPPFPESSRSFLEGSISTSWGRQLLCISSSSGIAMRQASAGIQFLLSWERLAMEKEVLYSIRLARDGSLLTHKISMAPWLDCEIALWNSTRLVSWKCYMLSTTMTGRYFKISPNCITGGHVSKPLQQICLTYSPNSYPAGFLNSLSFILALPWKFKCLSCCQT